MKIRAKLILLSFGVVLVTAISLVGLGIWQGNDFKANAAVQVEELVTNQMDGVSGSVIQMVEMQNKTIQDQVKRSLDLMQYLVEDQGGIKLVAPGVTWKAINSLTQQVTSVDLPRFAVGGVWIEPNDDFHIETRIVDPVFKLSNTQATLLQVMNDKGDLLRVATNIEDSQHKRAVGTYIPAVLPDGHPNPVVTAVMSGKPFQGVAYLLTDWYVANYLPVQDAAGKTIAVLSVAIRQKDLEAVQNVISNAKIGQRGFVFIAGGTGGMRGQMILSSNAGLNGRNILQNPNPELAKAGQTLIDQATALKNGEVVTANHLWQNPGEDSPRAVMTRLSYYPAWDWVIGVTRYESDFAAYDETLNQVLVRMILLFIVIGLGIGLGMAALTWYTSGLITRPIQLMTRTARALAEGDMDQEIRYTSRDEMGELAEAFRQMIAYLRQMAQAAERLAGGDLTITVEPRSERDYPGQAFRRMIQGLRGAIGQVSESSAQLARASEELTEAADQAGQASYQITQTMQEIASGIGQQAGSSSSTNHSLDNLHQSIQTVATGAEKQAGASQNASDVVQQFHQALARMTQAIQNASNSGSEVASASQAGADKVQNTIQAISNIRAAMETSAQKVQVMGERSNQIGVMAETIEEIASQTNLLALNAAIEAARAGESGRGFAVVADEVRKLAERASKSSREIHDLVKGIRTVADESIRSIQQSRGEVEAGVEKANQAGDALENIQKTARSMVQDASLALSVTRSAADSSNRLLDAIDTVAGVAEENTASARQMNSQADAVSQAMENIASISQENSAAVEEVCASAEEMSAQVEEVSATAGSLKEMAQRLQQSVGQFRLN